METSNLVDGAVSPNCAFQHSVGNTLHLGHVLPSND